MMFVTVRLIIFCSDAGTKGPGGGGGTGPSNFFSYSYSNKRVQILPILYYMHPQFFSPSGITDSINRASY